MATFIDILIGLFLVCFGGIGYHLIYTWYKEKEWAKNNPDEYKMQYPIEDKPKAPRKSMME
jgi:hypothetical protein